MMGNKVKIINIAKDYSLTPFGRYPTDGKFNGQRFRKERLLPALEDYDVVVVELDGTTISYGSSFLEESFGGLVRVEGMKPEEVKKRVTVRTELEDYKLEIDFYIDRASTQMEHQFAH